MSTVYSYLRFSAKHQAKGSSIDRQVEKREQWLRLHPEHTLDTKLKKLGLDLIDPGKSGYYGINLQDGGALWKFIELMKQANSPIEKGSILLIESLDRFSRLPPTEVQPIFYDIVKSGITVQTLTPEQTITAANINNPEVLYPITGYMIAAHEASKQKQDWIRKAWTRARSKGKVLRGSCPNWLVWNEKKEKYDIKDGAKELLISIFEMACDGMGQKTIAHALNEKGIKPLGRGKHWYSASVAWLIQNRQLLGEYQHHRNEVAKGRSKRIPEGQVIPDYYPRVIDDDLFNRANGVRISRLKCRGPNVLFCNLFIGLVHCSDGFPMWIKGAKHYREDGTSILQRRLYSQGRVVHAKGHNPVGVDYWIVEKLVMATLNEIDSKDLMPRKRDDGELNKLLATRAGIEGQIAKLQEAMVDYSPNAKPLDMILSAIDKLSNELIEVNGRIDKKKQDDAAIDDSPLEKSKDLLVVIESTQDEKQKHLLMLKLRGLIAVLIDRIEIDPYKVGAFCWARIEVKFKSGAIVRIRPDNEGIWHYTCNDRKKHGAMILRDIERWEASQTENGKHHPR